MARSFRGRPSRRELTAANNATHRFYAAASERPEAQANLEKLLVEQAPKRAYVRRPVDGRSAADLEGPVVAAVSELLSNHPQVMFAVRQNSGAMPWQRDGKLVPVWFYKIVRSPVEVVTIPDFWGLLKDGRMFALEAKRPSFKEPKEPREFKQAAFLMLVRNCGGVGGFVRSVEEAQAILA